MGNYYDGTKLLSLKDINGDTPELYICSVNRTAGKTTYFARLCVNRFLERGEKFAIFNRFNYELDDCADKFFKDISTLFFKGMTMTSQRKANGIYHELFINQKSCGYAMALNNADTLKKYSHLFSDVERIFFDELQSETNHYCSNEVKKFLSLHTTIARGQNKQVRYVPVYAITNPVTLLNPYYTELDISARLNDKTKFLKGNGFVLEQGYNESAAKAQSESGINKAFAKNEYVAYKNQKIYLNDNIAFVEKPNGKGQYIATLKYKGKLYAIREYSNDGFIYCDDHADTTFPTVLSVTTEDHNVNCIMINKNGYLIKTLKYYFEQGCFRFKNLQCKEVILKMLSL